MLQNATVYIYEYIPKTNYLFFCFLAKPILFSVRPLLTQILHLEANAACKSPRYTPACTWYVSLTLKLRKRQVCIDPITEPLRLK